MHFKVGKQVRLGSGLVENTVSLSLRDGGDDCRLFKWNAREIRKMGLQTPNFSFMLEKHNLKGSEEVVQVTMRLDMNDSFRWKGLNILPLPFEGS